MALQLFYVDESFNDKKFCLTAMWIRHREWRACMDAVAEHRAEMMEQFGIRIHKEIHAREFVAGRGELGENVSLTKWQRSRVYLGILRLITRLHVRLINVCLDVERHGKKVHMVAWDRLVNRIERSMKKIDEDEAGHRARLLASAERTMAKDDFAELKLRIDAFACRAMIISDEGHEADITGALRRMGEHNPIPS